jgi:hypothetical protein
MSIEFQRSYGDTYQVPGEGLYVARFLDDTSIINLSNFIHKMGITRLSPEDANNLHCTIVYSRATRCAMRDRHTVLPQVAFGSNALLPGYLSSQLIGECLNDTGCNWPDLDKGEVPGLVDWFSFPVIPPPRSHAQPVRVDFDIVPVFGPRFFRA